MAPKATCLSSQVWWYTSKFLVFGRLRQKEGHKFKANQGYIKWSLFSLPQTGKHTTAIQPLSMPEKIKNLQGITIILKLKKFTSRKLMT